MAPRAVPERDYAALRAAVMLLADKLAGRATMTVPEEMRTLMAAMRAVQSCDQGPVNDLMQEFIVRAAQAEGPAT